MNELVFGVTSFGWIDTSEMKEIALSGCEFGCKIYQHPSGYQRVFHHNIYGCPKPNN